MCAVLAKSMATTSGDVKVGEDEDGDARPARSVDDQIDRVA
jgi:hypothetical protein